MAISIVNKDILGSEADAIILTLDGPIKGIEGNIAQSFAKNFPTHGSR